MQHVARCLSAESVFTRAYISIREKGNVWWHYPYEPIRRLRGPASHRFGFSDASRIRRAVDRLIRSNEFNIGAVFTVHRIDEKDCHRMIQKTRSTSQWEAIEASEVDYVEAVSVVTIRVSVRRLRTRKEFLMTSCVAG